MNGHAAGSTRKSASASGSRATAPIKITAAVRD